MLPPIKFYKILILFDFNSLTSCDIKINEKLIKSSECLVLEFG